MPFSVSLSIAVAILISILAWYNYRIGKISQRVAILLISWSLGNAIDRIILGGVRDFLSIPTFAIINIADIAITIGVILYVYYALFPCKVHPKNYL
jgi:signal peptidase II